MGIIIAFSYDGDERDGWWIGVEVLDGKEEEWFCRECNGVDVYKRQGVVRFCLISVILFNVVNFILQKNIIIIHLLHKTILNPKFMPDKYIMPWTWIIEIDHD